MALDKDSLRALQSATQKLKKRFGNEVIADTLEIKKYEVIPSGSAIIDDAIGIAGQSGYPLGRLVEIYGPESSGKTSICMSAVAQAQKKYPNKMVLYIDAEHAFNLEYAQKFGINTNPDAFIFCQPGSAEEALEIFNTYAETGAFSVIVLDSIAAMATEAQLAKGMDEKTMGSLAGVLSPGLTKIKGSLSQTNTLGLFVNQTRDSIGMFTSGETTPGGKALRFYCSLRIRVSKKDLIVDPTTKDTIGQDLKIDFKKNKVGTPYKVVETKLIFGQGFDYESEYFDMAVVKNVIHKGGAWYSWIAKDGETVIKLQGKLACVALLKANQEEYEYLKELVINSGVETPTELLAVEEQDEELD
jgi:recombination protein RecA